MEISRYIQLLIVRDYTIMNIGSLKIANPIFFISKELGYCSNETITNKREQCINRNIRHIVFDEISALFRCRYYPNWDLHLS